jgi:hypothetical protein
MECESERRELWHQLDNESDRAHAAFEYYMLLPPAERSVVRAWREWSGNPDAKREPPYFAGWAKDFAWSDRARARDHHLEVIRERGMEKAIEEEAAQQARQTERLRYRQMELVTRIYERAIASLDNDDYWDTMQPQDVINIVRLHLDSMVKLGEMMPQDDRVVESDWNEEHAAELDRTLGDIEAEREEETPEPDEFGDEEGGSEESEGDQD